MSPVRATSLDSQSHGEDLVAFYEALLSRPEEPALRAALGCALARGGYFKEAVGHLQRALADDPFDNLAARALFYGLAELGDTDGRRRLAEERRRLAQESPDRVPVEPWFTEPLPRGDELASIIILCCNEVACTRQCLDSVVAHTRPPYELVLVDNGSTDSTVAFLDEVSGRPGPVRVEVIRNETNRGFPAGCNQALAKAQGRYLVFLNNDTVVTAGWLEGLIAWTVHDWPRVGLVGAVSNYAASPQQVPAGYADPQGLEAFAAARRGDFAGKAVQVDRLSGFLPLSPPRSARQGRPLRRALWPGLLRRR
jgi:hypothetical protein